MNWSILGGAAIGISLAAISYGDVWVAIPAVIVSNLATGKSMYDAGKEARDAEKEKTD